MGKTAILLGATGLVGGHCRDLLLDDPGYDRVIMPVRRKPAKEHPKAAYHTVDFNDLDSVTPLIQGDVLLCCLGTTIKKAGSKDAFRFVDEHLPIELCKSAAVHGVPAVLVVTALGADPGSAVFYNQVKGRVEQRIADMGIHSATFLRPSLLLGDRAEFRPGERMGEMLLTLTGFALVGPLRKYRGIQARDVARVMVARGKTAVKGVTVLESDAIQNEADNL